ncbi:hypothetical protein JST97_32135 [bacterium]|nr:hypothetical protein [bacterium]
MRKFLFIALLLLTGPVFCELGVGVKGYITDPGRRAVEASKGYYDFYLKPGDTVEHVIEVENTGDQPGVFYVYPADGTSSPAGTLVGGVRGQDPSRAGTWLKVEKESLQLEPKARERVAFRLSVPAQTPVGEYFSYVFIEPDSPAQPQSENASRSNSEVHSGVRVRSRIGMLIITFVGDTSLRQPDWKWEGQGKAFDNGEIFYCVRLQNTGNVFLKPRVKWSLLGPNGNIVSHSKGEDEFGYIVSGSDLLLRFPLSGGQLLPRGEYQLQWSLVDLRYPQLTRESSLRVSLP